MILPASNGELMNPQTPTTHRLLCLDDELLGTGGTTKYPPDPVDKYAVPSLALREALPEPPKSMGQSPKNIDIRWYTETACQYSIMAATRQAGADFGRTYPHMCSISA